MKKITIVSAALGSLLMQASAFATLPASSVSTLGIYLYGMYTTNDPTCQTGLIATVPLSSTATLYNFAAQPTLGTNPVLSSSPACAIIVMKNTINETWAAGTYTSTTQSGNNQTYQDSQCNAGGSLTQTVCQNTSFTWPAQITTDAAAAGLTLSTSCASSPTGSEVVGLYMSTNSACTGNKNIDPTTCNNSQAFNAPTSKADIAHGVTLTPPATTGTIYFEVNPSSLIGACGGVNNSCISTGTGLCGGASPPLFSFHN